MPCGVRNPDVPDAGYSCEYPPGHERIWRYGAWQDHGAPSHTVWWVVPPYGEDELQAVSFVVNRAKDNPHIAALLVQELMALGWALERTGDEYGTHAARADEYPETRAAGYTVIPPEFSR